MATIKPKTGTTTPTTGDIVDKEMAVDLTTQKLYVRDGVTIKEISRQPTTEEIEDIAGGLVTGNTETGITVTYETSDNTLDFVVAYGTAANTAAEGNDSRINNGQTAFGWGDHASGGYLTSETSHTDVVVDGDFTLEGLMRRGATSGTYSIVTDNSSDWNTAFGWGNHASGGYEVTSAKGANNGYAGLDANGKVLTTQMPALALTEVSVVANETAQLALTAQEGDVAIRTDTSTTYIHNGGTAGTMADWEVIEAPVTETDPVFSASDVAGVTTSDITNWDTAYGDKINSASFATGTGILTLTRQDAGTVTVNLDGRYTEPGDDADQFGSGAAADGEVLTADGAGNAAWEASGIPTGTDTQTLRNSGGTWFASSTLVNDGTNIGIGIAPTRKLHVSASTATIRVQDSDGTNQTVDLSNSGGATILQARNNVSYGPIQLRQYNGTTTQTPFYIDTSQQIGMGTTAPERKLHVAAADGSSNVAFFDAHGIVSNVSLRASNGTQASPTQTVSGDDLGHLNFRGYNGADTAFKTASAGIKAVAAETYSVAGYLGAHLTFLTAGTAGGAYAEHMRITSAGDVGIGTTSISRRLHVLSTEQTVARLESSGISSQIEFKDSSGDTGRVYIGNKGGDAVIQTGNPVAERVRVDSDGNVAIGTTSPEGYKLNASGGSLGTTLGNRVDVFQLNWDAATNEQYLRFFGERTATGSTWSNAGMRIQAVTDTTEQAFLEFNGLAGSYGFGIATGTNPTALDFVVDSAGNVGIGETTPDSKLHVTGADDQVRIQDSAGSAAMLSFYDSSDVFVGRLQSSAGDMFLDARATGGDLVLRTNGTDEGMRILSDGNTGMGTASPQVDAGYNTLTLNGTDSQLVLRRGDANIGGFYTAAGELAAFTVASTDYVFYNISTELLRVASNGNMTLASGGDFSVASGNISANGTVTAAAGGEVRAQGDGDFCYTGTAGYVKLGSSSGPFMAMGQADGLSGAALSFNDLGGTKQRAGYNSARIEYNVDSTSSAAMLFKISEQFGALTERLRIDNAGIDVTGDTTMTGDLTISGNNAFMSTTAARVKYGVYSDTTYGMGFDSLYTFGGLDNQWAVTFQNSSTAGRGFWWGDSSHDTNAKGAMALTNDGLLTVAGGVRIGYGQLDTTAPGTTGLDVTGTIDATGIIETTGASINVDNTSGTLTVGIDTSGPCGFSVNDGGGNANVWFNERSNAKQTSGQNSGRITFNTDATTGSVMAFETGSGATVGIERARVDDAGFDVTGAITATGNITAYSSDIRLKENIRPIEGALYKLNQLRGVHFDWKDDVDALGFTPLYRKDDVGFIAQEVEAVLPQAAPLAPFDSVTTEKGEASKSGQNYKTVSEKHLLPLVVQAMKEQQELIEGLQLQIAVMQGKLDGLTN